MYIKKYSIPFLKYKTTQKKSGEHQCMYNTSNTDDHDAKKMQSCSLFKIRVYKVRQNQNYVETKTCIS